MLRPGVVWFGEALPRGVWEAAERAVCSAEVLLVVGTSALVYPAAGLAPMARRAGARVVEVNVEETPLSAQVDSSLRGSSGELLPQLIA
jgi:NAD-dependent deacetylase